MTPDDFQSIPSKPVTHPPEDGEARIDGSYIVFMRKSI